MNLYEQWIYDGKFTYQGITYIRGVNDTTAELLLHKIEPQGYGYKPVRRDPIKCKLYNHQEYIGHMDLQSVFHKGFTIGKGSSLYWCLIWHPSGHATCYPVNEKQWPRYVHGDTDITIHFKPAN